MQSPSAAATDRDPTLETLHLVASGLVQQLQSANFTVALPAATKKAAAMVHSQPSPSYIEREREIDRYIGRKIDRKIDRKIER
jgi:hypothetical protein